MSNSNQMHDAAKIFVGGLSWQTTEEPLRYHFEQYGEVVSVEVMRDRNTGDPRGFAFVVFKEDSTVELVMQNQPHEINHKIVDVKRAQARGSAPPSIHGGKPDKFFSNDTNGGSNGQKEMSPEELQNKIFVGGLPLYLNSDGLKQFFEKFGAVVDAIVMIDSVQQRSRGFGFVTFENGTNGAKKALAQQPIFINDKYVEIKLATPKGEQKKSLDHAGLRNAAAALSNSQNQGEFAGLAASYGRQGWKAGYGSYAFGSRGWAVKGWEDGQRVSVRSGFSFEHFIVHSESHSAYRKRDRDEVECRKVKRERHK